MHDPLTVAFRISNPFRKRGYAGHEWHPPLVTIWHKDPEKRGSDDSCDWFGNHRRLNAREQKLAMAIAGSVPDPLRDQWFLEAYHEWRRRRGLRWHPRWHFHHWRFQLHLRERQEPAKGMAIGEERKDGAS